MTDSFYFISYANADSEFAQKLAWDLQAKGITTWLDAMNNKPGASWDDARRSALTTAQGVIALFSAQALSSSDFLEEYAHTLLENLRMLPVLVESCDLPSEVRKFSIADCSSNYETGLNNLLETISQPYQQKRQALNLTPLSEREPTTNSQTSKLPTRWVNLASTGVVCSIVFGCLIYAMYPRVNIPKGSTQETPTPTTSIAKPQGSFQKTAKLSAVDRVPVPIAASAEYKARLADTSLTASITTPTSSTDLAVAVSEAKEPIKFISLSSPESATTCKGVKGMSPVDQATNFTVKDSVYFWSKLNVKKAQKLTVKWQDASTEKLLKERVLNVSASEEYRVFDQFKPTKAGAYRVVLMDDAAPLKEIDFNVSGSR
jgi:hypothetical protein